MVYSPSQSGYSKLSVTLVILINLSELESLRNCYPSTQKCFLRGILSCFQPYKTEVSASYRSRQLFAVGFFGFEERVYSAED
jgi:hypothetical protein